MGNEKPLIEVSPIHLDPKCIYSGKVSIRSKVNMSQVLWHFL